MPRDKAIDFSALTLQSAVLDSLAAHIAVLDGAGTIVAVNLSWETFAAANGMNDANAGIGVNYLEVCQAAAPDPNADEALNGIRAVMEGRAMSFYFRYPCHGPMELRWFALRVSPLRDHPNFVVVAHENITEQVLTRISPRSTR